jgi:Uma2 family endonuclease
MNTVVLNLEPIVHLSDEQFYQLCIVNRDLSLEMNAAGELIIVPPVSRRRKRKSRSWADR